MFARVKGLLDCAQGRHRRSENSARKVGEQFLSMCEHCGVGMRRLSKRNWVVAQPWRWGVPDA